jgi:A/G-specific adenine glycosylase
MPDGREFPTPPQVTELRTRLAQWFRQCGRSFPWRDTRHPFHVLTAELMLQRTRAEQVEPVWLEFSRIHDGPADVLDAGRAVVDSLFDSLGLRWRAAHYWALCGELVADYAGRVPDDYASLVSLPGVGQYAAGATLTNAFAQPTGVVDSNILRIYGRYFGIQFSDSDRRRVSVLKWAQDSMPRDPKEAMDYNLALVDLGAMICTPRAPRCEACSLSETCRYAGDNRPQATLKG